ncbi:AAA family ATPase [Coprinopsis marcescibilis]|uniref:AAA family ATPase n=1 Tax=Coprinopsis marcescibilis TaxID=230819 RepID=A0A5C3KNE3_COPMA|nr:AAA family ATPase [Coprinopsis marcescibilis]
MANIFTKSFSTIVSEEYGPRTARRITVNPDILKSSKLCTGDVVAVTKSQKSNPQKMYRQEVRFDSISLGTCPFKLNGLALEISLSHALTAGLEEGEPARLYPLTGAASASKPPGLPSVQHAKEARKILLQEMQMEGSEGSTEKEEKLEWLTLLLREHLVDLKYLMLNQIIEITFEGRQRRFSLNHLDTTLDDHPRDLSSELSELWIATWDIQVLLDNSKSNPTASTSQKTDFETLAHQSTQDAYSSVGGLSKQISEIRDLLEIPLTRPELFQHFGLKPPRGILLHGPPGTGKTHLARAIASSTQSSVLVINGPELSSAYHGETESKLREVFKEAHKKSPCIVVLDEVDALVPRREDSAGGEVEKRVVATLLTILDGMDGDNESSRGKVVVIGTTNRPNAIDPALRRPGRFDREIEIGIPDAEARLSILNVLLKNTPNSISQSQLHSLASRAHGYVGADLSAAVREAGTIAIKRWVNSIEGDKPPLILDIADLEAALPIVRPSAMRSLFVEAPPVRYSEIGGQASVIQKLREAVEWPLLHPEAFSRLGVKPPKGVLLYGPPGCSKTVLARACACESGVNFVAVKGPELLNKFVGESERAVREVFRKARAAAPSIIFFDEIDALATSRKSSDNDSGSSHEGVLTSLLNEMDGVQELIGVTVVAATNRPEALDSALMRPGRLDRILFVGPPDMAGREEIFKIKLKAMTVALDIDIPALAAMTEGCSGAEISVLCQEAALLTMREDMDAVSIPHSAFVTAARSTKRQITSSVLAKFTNWKDGIEVRQL